MFPSTLAEGAGSELTVFLNTQPEYFKAGAESNFRRQLKVGGAGDRVTVEEPLNPPPLLLLRLPLVSRSSGPQSFILSFYNSFFLIKASKLLVFFLEDKLR